MHDHALRALPIVGKARHVIGLVTRAHFLRYAEPGDHRSLARRLQPFLRRTPHTCSDKDEVVVPIMKTPVTTARDTAPIAELVPLMSDAGPHHVPLVDREK